MSSEKVKTEKPAEKSKISRKVRVVVGAIIIILIIAIAGGFDYVVKKLTSSNSTLSGRKSVKDSNQGLIVPINTSVYREIKVTYGKRGKRLNIIPQNGRVYAWYVVINKDFKSPRLMPSAEEFGDNVQTLHCILAENQGIETAEIEYEEE